METHYISRQGLDALRNYKYKGGEYSFLDLQMNGFWLWCAELLPMSMAPNLVTLVGTGHLLLVVMLAQIFDPQLLGESPWWVYAINAWCLFVYQTMDAVDGKQARRTGTSSPLGQLFDHGCDSMGTTFIAVSLVSVLGFGASTNAIIIIATVQIPFYLCQWEENHVHVLRAQVGNFGVTEGQFLSMGLNLSAAVFGSVFWQQTVAELVNTVSGLDLPGLGGLEDAELRTIAVYVGGFFPFLLAMSNVIAVFKSNVNFARALILTIPLWLQQGIQVALHVLSPGKELFETHPVPFIVIMGMLHSHLSNRIIVASVCHIEIPLLQKIIMPIPFIIGLLVHENSHTNAASKMADKNTLATVLIVYGAFVVFQYFHFVLSVINSICLLLDINCLTIKDKKKT
ncbi:Uncharacterized CDP-alcohol phosphatidyltransferase class-I family protein 1 [Durusdinium trenchii]|uniref:Uncharacterized CDP-alcohol phosphatidyltransferase class-I family protein 1 n=1 Tax=Durusdinium trenchii TaxID=1381693 RepID=A0ABP0HB56_9DINO